MSEQTFSREVAVDYMLQGRECCHGNVICNIQDGKLYCRHPNEPGKKWLHACPFLEDYAVGWSLIPTGPKETKTVWIPTVALKEFPSYSLYYRSPTSTPWRKDQLTKCTLTYEVEE